MYEKLAENIIKNSLKRDVKGKKIFVISNGFAGAGAVREISAAIAREGGIPCAEYFDLHALAAFLDNATEEQIEAYVEALRARYADAGGFVRALAEDDLHALENVNPARRALYIKLYAEKVRDAIMLKTNWVLFLVPTQAHADLAKMELAELTELAAKVSSLDYSEMNAAMEPLAALMSRTKKVHITGRGTDIGFSIEGMPAVKSAGECNIPDGEVFTAPVRESVNGVVQFNTMLVYSGQETEYENIRLRFENGRVAEFSSEKNGGKLAEFFATDEGSRYVGEFALGLNPFITRPTGDILFDEKIAGSFHMALGNCCEGAVNGNRSLNHFDMICIQTPEYGGGEIWFDDVLIRKDGRFVVPELAGLNPENLIR